MHSTIELLYCFIVGFQLSLGSYISTFLLASRHFYDSFPQTFGFISSDQPLSHVHVHEQHAQAQGRKDREEKGEEVRVPWRGREGGGGDVEKEHDQGRCLEGGKGGREEGRFQIEELEEKLKREGSWLRSGQTGGTIY